MFAKMIGKNLLLLLLYYKYW